MVERDTRQLSVKSFGIVTLERATLRPGKSIYFRKCLPPYQLINEWHTTAKSSDPSIRIFGMAMLRWNGGAMAKTHGYVDCIGSGFIQHDSDERQIFKDIHGLSAPDTRKLIDRFERNFCVLGLVLLAGVRNGNERELAIRALGRVAIDHDITTCTHVVSSYTDHYHTDSHYEPGQLFSSERDILHPHEDIEVTFTKLFSEPELVGRIAVEEQSVQLASYILSSSLRIRGLEKTRPLISLLIEAGDWHMLDCQLSNLSSDIILKVAKHMEGIAFSRTRYILPTIAATNPDQKVREQAVLTIENGGADNPGNIPYCLVLSAAESHFFDTAKFAIDKAVAIIISRFNSGNKGRIADVGLSDLLKKDVDPYIQQYALQRLFEVWDQYSGYDYAHIWDTAPTKVQNKIMAYFEQNFDRLVAQREFDAILWIYNHSQGILQGKRRRRAFNALVENLDRLPLDHFVMLQTIHDNLTDPDKRARAVELIARYNEDKKRQSL